MHSQIKKQGRGGFDLRPYQDEALNRFRELYDDGTNRQLLAAAVGTGKTVVAAHLPAWFPHLGRQGFLWIVHREELAYQAAETFKQCWPNRSVGIEMADHTASRHCDIVVASRQTLAHPKSDRLQKFDRQDDFGVIGIDEAHHATRDSQYDLICNYFGVGSNQDFPMSSGKKRLLTGFTATPNRHDGEGLHHFFDEITKSYDLRWGVEQGWLVDITATRIDTDTDISGVSSRMGDFAASELEEAVDTHERNEVIAKAFLEHGGKKALAYTVGVDQAHSLAHELNQHGINAKALDAKTPDDERKETVERFKNGDLQVVSNVGVLTEGFNAPAADTILMARPTKSEMLYNQILGRATRPTVNLNGLSKSERLQRINSSDKPHMRIIDFVDAVGNHEIVTAPSLFGLTQDFDTKGESITHAIKHIEAKERENPGKPFREAASLDEVEIIAEQTSVWDIATSTDEVPFDCDLMWMQTGETRYELQVPVEEDIRAKTARLGVVPAFAADDDLIRVSAGEAVPAIRAFDEHHLGCVDHRVVAEIEVLHPCVLITAGIGHVEGAVLVPEIGEKVLGQCILFGAIRREGGGAVIGAIAVEILQIHAVDARPGREGVAVAAIGEETERDDAHLGRAVALQHPVLHQNVEVVALLVGDRRVDDAAARGAVVVKAELNARHLRELSGDAGEPAETMFE